MRGLDLERNDEERSDDVSIARGGGGSSDPKSTAVLESELEVSEKDSLRREIVVDRDVEYRLRSLEWRLMRDTGKFGVIAVNDLRREIYQGCDPALNHDLRALQKQGLIRRLSIPTSLDEERLSLVVLTDAGKALLERTGSNDGERISTGFLKPREALHDAMLYRMFHQEADRIERSGGEISKVILEAELKSKTWSEIAKLRKEQPSWSEGARRGAAADTYGLPIVKGRIVFPDVRVHYQDERGVAASVDLELATEHYRRGHISTKLQAGFRVYLPAAGFSTRRHGEFLEDRGMAAILSK